MANVSAENTIHEKYMKPDEELQIFDVKNRIQLQRKIISKFIEEHFSHRDNSLRVLEAGCGRKWHMNIRGIDYVLTGLDISKDALELRKNEEQDLDEAILADLRMFELKADYFDVIYCSSVLEHISGAQPVLEKFVEWLRPSGLLILIIPDRDSIFGFITRITPFWFHVFFYKYIKKIPNAGKDPYGPYPVYYDKIVSRQGILNFCRRHNNKILFEYGHKYNYYSIFGVFSPLVDMLFKFVEIVSFGKITSGHSGLTYIIEKPQGLD